METQVQENCLVTWFASPLVPETTNREPEDLILDGQAGQARIAEAVEQVHVVRVAAIDLCRTPKVRAPGAEVANVVLAANRQGGKTEGIRSVAIARPTRLRLENLACRILTADGIEQSFPFVITWQVPTLGADALNQGR